MSFQSEFVASPETFMKTNVVTPQFMDVRDGHPGPPSQSRPIIVTIKPWPNKVCSKRGGGAYFLSRDLAGLGRDEKLPIYWLAYKQNEATQGVLSNQSRYMFTALMNGCSLGFGTQGGDGACIVSHANKASAGSGGRAHQRGEQMTQLRGVFGDGAFNVIEPDAYQSTSHGGFGVQATNFGRNVRGTWQFYSHRWMASGGTGGVILHCGCDPAVSVPS